MADQGTKKAGLPEAPTDAFEDTAALRDAGQRLLGLLVQQSAEAATRRVNGLTVRLSDVRESGGDVRAALRGKSQGDGRADGRAGGLRQALGGALSGLKEKVRSIFGGGGGAKELKLTNLLEGIEVGLPLRTTYDAWTQLADFPSFTKVDTVGPAADERNWTAKLFLFRSPRPWDATIIEQVPDSRIVWRSAGAEGHVDGAVSFTRLGPQVTQVLLVLEWPKGLFERPGNLWRARARRARLDLEQFRRQALAHVLVRQKEVRGWRGEIRDGAVVTTHEEALEQDRKAQEGMGPDAAEEEEEVTPQEGVAEDESAADSTADEYAVGDQGEEDQVGEEKPRPVGSSRPG